MFIPLLIRLFTDYCYRNNMFAPRAVKIHLPRWGRLNHINYNLAAERYFLSVGEGACSSRDKQIGIFHREDQGPPLPDIQKLQIIPSGDARSISDVLKPPSGREVSPIGDEGSLRDLKLCLTFIITRSPSVASGASFLPEEAFSASKPFGYPLNYNLYD